jgi:hypothetical protein
VQLAAPEDVLLTWYERTSLNERVSVPSAAFIVCVQSRS